MYRHNQNLERDIYVKKPVIIGEWKTLFRPVKAGCYVNDHSLVQDHRGAWHLFGITSHDGSPANERYFVHARAEQLISDEEMEEIGIVIDHGTRAWSPGVIQNKKQYYMYYGPSPTKLAISEDLNEWMGYEIGMCGQPPMSCHRDHFVMKLNEYTWMMYVAGVKDGYGAISCLVSNDLLNWRFVQYALTSEDDAPLKPGWGAFESPYVVKYGEFYYLFVTYTDCSIGNYQNTLVFASTNPYCFGTYTKSRHQEMVVAELCAHAGEVLFDECTNSYYITTCGWRDYGIPIEGGVGIAKLEWQHSSVGHL